MIIPNWVKRVFCSREEFAEYYLPPLDNILPTPKVMPPKPELDISEPVLALVENFKKHPHLWKVRRDIDRVNITMHYSVEDIRNKEVFETCVYKSLVRYERLPNCSWMTLDEQRYCEREYLEMHDMKVERVRKIRAIRKEITDNNERNRLKGIYQ